MRIQDANRAELGSSRSGLFINDDDTDDVGSKSALSSSLAISDFQDFPKEQKKKRQHQNTQMSRRSSLRVAAQESAEEVADLKGSGGSKLPAPLRNASKNKGRRRAMSVGHFADINKGSSSVAAGKKIASSARTSRKRAMSILDFVDGPKAKGGRESAAKVPSGRKR